MTCPHDFSQVLKIKEQAGFVEFFTGQRDPHFVVVAVRILTLSLVIAQVVACGKRVFYGNFKHEVLERRIGRASGCLLYFNASRVETELC